MPAPGSPGGRPRPPGRTSATRCIRPGHALLPQRAYRVEKVVEPALAFADRTLRGRLADEERNAVAMVIKSAKPRQEIARPIGLPDAKTAVRLPLETLVGKHRIEIEADDRQIDRMFLQPIEIALVPHHIPSAMTQGVMPVHPTADEVERQKDDLLAAGRLVREARIGGFIKVGRIDMNGNDRRVDCFETRTSHDAAATAIMTETKPASRAGKAATSRALPQYQAVMRGSFSGVNTRIHGPGSARRGGRHSPRQARDIRG